MNRALLSSVKYIKTKYGEDILGDPARLNPEFAKYAKNEPKEERVAFGRCIETGCYRELKKARTEDERINAKNNLAFLVHNKYKIPVNQCHDALDILEEVIFGSVSQSAPNYQNLSPVNSNPIGPTPPPINNNIPSQNQHPPQNDKKMILRMFSKFALLFVVIGFFMPITCGLNAFQIADYSKQAASFTSGNSIGIDIRSFCIYAMFFLSCIGVFIGLLLLMKIQVPIKYDWYDLLAVIGILIYYIFSNKLQEGNMVLQQGAYFILVGLGMSFILLLSTGSGDDNNSNNVPPGNNPP